MAHDVTIPPAALEAGAKALCKEARLFWPDLNGVEHDIMRNEARAAFLAMIEAWDGMHTHEWQRPWLGGMSGTDLILPLPQEASDAKR